MFNQVTDLPREATDDVLSLWTDAAPERKIYLAEIMKDVNPAFIKAGDRPGAMFEAGTTMIQYNQRTLDVKWLLAHAAWAAIESYSGILCYLSLLHRPLIATEIAALPNQAKFNGKYTRLKQKADELLTIDDLNLYQWPSDILRPRAFDGPKRQRATRDLLLMAVAFTFLHELKHTMFRAEGKDYALRDEETACDRFAADMMLDEARSWASRTRWSPNAVLFKRATAVALGCFIIAIITRPAARRGSVTHPPVGDRLRALCLSVDLPASNKYWICLASFVLALLELENRVPAMIEFRGRKDLATKLANAL